MAVKLIVISGFLGSGKTSSILQMAKALIADGKKVGVITNDQGKNLVDTSFLAKEGLSVFEVSQGCFCCNFDQFTNNLKTITEENSPDYIIAEPIGSAINLITTIFKPIMNVFTKDFSLAPLSVITDPKRIKRLISNDLSCINFGEEINYLFDKQLSEADYIVINKIDTLSESEQTQIYDYLKNKYPWAEILSVSAKNNIGIQEWLDKLIDNNSQDKKPLEIDYEIFKKAEKNLAWLNLKATFSSSQPLDYNEIINEIISNIQTAVVSFGNEIAHIKAYAVAENDFAKASVTSSGDIIGFNCFMESKATTVNFILNERVEIPFEKLTEISDEAINNVCIKYGITQTDKSIESFAPSYAKPKCVKEKMQIKF